MINCFTITIFAHYQFKCNILIINECNSDQNLVERLQKGDAEAFDLIFSRYSERLYGFAFKYLKSKEETEGLVQDVFLTIWENRKNLKKESSLKSYLFTISYHNICRIFRRKGYQKNLIREISASDYSYSIDNKIDYQSALEQVNLLIEQMPPRQKTIFIKSRKEGKSTREIAEEMNLVPGTVDNLISMALKFLRERIGDNLSLLLYFSFFIQ